MKRITTMALIGLFASTIAFAQNDNPFTLKWDKSFKLESEDKQFKLGFGGRLMLDYVSLSQDSDLEAGFGELEEKSEFNMRRGRIFFSGLLYGNTEIKFEVDFAGEEISIKDAYIGLKKLPVVGNLRIGHLKEPFHLDNLSSSKYMVFMERSSGEVLTRARNNGLIVFNEFLDNKLGLQLGYFLNSKLEKGETEPNGHAIITRASYRFIKQKNQILQLGASYSHKKKDSETFAVAARTEANVGLKYIGTGDITDVKREAAVNFEAMYSKGPWAFQSEYTATNVALNNNSIDGNYNFSSYYGQISYFLTGEHRSLKKSYGGVSAVKPKNNFGGQNNGAGAWEVAFRYSHTDFNSKNVLGGVENGFTLGLNFYLNPATRFMINYVKTNVDTPIAKGNSNILQARFQIEF